MSCISESFLKKDFFATDTLTVARELLGLKLVYADCEGVIVETEAYRDDPASHAVTRPNKGRMLRETFGCVYIYFIYGKYHCLNFTTEKNGVGAVLIRAVEPIAGIEQMRARRQKSDRRQLTSGPGKLFQAFGLDPKHHGEEVGQSIRLSGFWKRNSFEIMQGARVGISRATELDWRFFVADSEFVSA